MCTVHLGACYPVDILSSLPTKELYMWCLFELGIRVIYICYGFCFIFNVVYMYVKLNFYLFMRMTIGWFLSPVCMPYLSLVLMLQQQYLNLFEHELFYVCMYVCTYGTPVY